MFALWLPRWTAIPLFLIAAALDLILIAAVAFHMPLDTIAASLRYTAAIDIAASAFYLFVLFAVASSALLAAWLLMRHRLTLRAASPTPAALLVLLLMLLDYKVNFPFTEVDGARSAQFENAVGKATLTPDSIAARGNNVLVVLVEGMGAFADQADKALVTAPLRTAAGRYDLVSGTTTYSGSTTAAEARELCGERGDHRTYLRSDGDHCLPAQLRNRGYDTISYHGFHAGMFDRDIWYPRIGFTRTNFGPDVRRTDGKAVPSDCGSVLKGLCDSELGTVVRRELQQRNGQPKFVYWLTLNSHIPFVPKDNGPLGCDSARPRIDNRIVCQLGEHWLDVFQSVAEIAADPSIAPTDILIVGDHHTPLWDRAAKQKFRLNEVDWFYLRHKTAQKQ